MTSKKMASINRKADILRLFLNQPYLTDREIAARVGGCGRAYVGAVIRSVKRPDAIGTNSVSTSPNH